VLCICAEQTFTEESAVDKHFGPAFSRAMVAYIGSSTEAEVIKEIRETVDLPEIGFQQTLDRIHDQARMLTEIIKNHPLRMWNSCLPPVALTMRPRHQGHKERTYQTSMVVPPLSVRTCLCLVLYSAML
jgi:hypothetical protein